jgi:hypothetical protein
MGAIRQGPANGSDDVGSAADQELTAAAMLHITLVATGQLDAAPAAAESAR